jgi:hypothetical protein
MVKPTTIVKHGLYEGDELKWIKNYIET